MIKKADIGIEWFASELDALKNKLKLHEECIEKHPNDVMASIEANIIRSMIRRREFKILAGNSTKSK